MTVLTQSPPIQASAAWQDAIPSEPIFPLSVAQYHSMIQTGVLTEADPVELLEGLLVRKMPKKPLHHVVTFLVRQALQKLIAVGWYVDSQEPVTTNDSEPEPAISVVRGEILNYLTRHPEPHEVALIVEVADATLQRDQGIKKRIYARAGLPVYWVVNLVRQEVVVYTEPLADATPPTYRQERVYRRGETMPVMLDGAEVGQVAVSDVIPELST
jgi:Uma2 family endonuclease